MPGSAPARLGKKSVRKSASAAPIKSVGSKSEVYKGLAKHTSGGLTKRDILRVAIKRAGKLVGYRYKSRAKSMMMKRRRVPVQGRMWRMALKQVTGGAIPRKGTQAYRMAKAVMRQLMRRGGVDTTPAMFKLRKSAKAGKGGRPRKARKAASA
jgi:hypothetical protein